MQNPRHTTPAPTMTRALVVTDDQMTSTATPPTATRTPGGWAVTWLPGRTLDRDAAAAAMTIAVTLAQIDGALVGDPERWPLVCDLAAELGLTGLAVAHLVQVVQPPTSERDRRFTTGLIHDVFEILKAHGYAQPDGDRINGATGRAVVALYNLAETFEGRQ